MKQLLLTLNCYRENIPPLLTTHEPPAEAKVIEVFITMCNFKGTFSTLIIINNRCVGLEENKRNENHLDQFTLAVTNDLFFFHLILKMLNLLSLSLKKIR